MEWSFVFFLNSALLGVGLAMDAFSVSLANGLSEPQMRQAFSCMQADFEMFTARIERIGLAESRPYTDIKVWKL